MNTFRLVAIWGMLAVVAVMTQHTAWDYAAGLCTIAAMLPMAIATGDPQPKRVTIAMKQRRRTR